MLPVRRLIRDYRAVAALLVALALALRLLVPAGYMPMIAQGSVVLAICDGAGPVTITAPAARTPMAGMHHHSGTPADAAPVPSKPASACAFADLSTPAMASVDAVLLVAAIAYAVALAIRRVVPLRVREHGHLRPPLRGPPALA